MNARTRFDVAVAGRGAVGAAAALGLAQAGLSVAWIGPAPRLPAEASGWDARVYALSPASRELLRTLRVWDALPAGRIAPVHDMRVYPGPQADAPELHLDAYSARIDALAWIVENRTLMRPLEDALRFAGVTAIDDAVTATTHEGSGAAGRMRLELESGRSVSARLVVAADGADSALRTLAGIEPRVRDYDQHAVVANFDTTLPHGDTAYQWFGPELGVLALLPLPADSPEVGRTSMVWSAPEALARELLALEPAALAARVAEASHGVLGRMTAITPAQGFALRLVRVPRLIAHRLVLVGDAAHAMHPLAGQGMNVGFGDVAEMLAVLRGREFYRDLGDPLLWRRYERARREAVTTMQDATDGLQRLFGPLPAPLAGLRDLGWRVVARSGWLRRQMIARAAR
jgi:2-octaprenylphenol hydroxylase